MVTIVNQVITEFSSKVNKTMLSNAKKVQGIMGQNKLFGESAGVSSGALNKIVNAKAATSALATKQNELRRIMGASGLELNKVTQGLSAMGFQANSAGVHVDALGKRFKRTKTNLAALSKSTVRFRMDLLSVMFLTMMLQRVVTGFIRSAITSFKKANEGTEGLGKTTWELSAAWEFFKYSLVDALTSSELFNVFIQGLLTIVQWFNELSPKTKAILAIAFAFFALSVIVSMIGVQFLLLGSALGGSGLLGGLGMALESFFTMLGLVMLALIGLALMVWGIVLIVKNWGKDWAEVLKGMGLAVLGLAIILGVLILAGVIAISWWWIVGLAIIAAIAFAVSWIIKHWEEIKIYTSKLVLWLKEKWIWFVYGIKMLFLGLVEAIFGYYKQIMKGLLKMISWIPGMDKITGPLKKALESVNDTFDDIKTSIKSTRDTALKAAQDEQAAYEKTLRAQIVAREAAKTATDEQTKKGGLLGGALGSSIPGKDAISSLTSLGANNTTNIDNSTNEFKVEIPAGIDNREEMANYTLEKLEEKWNSKTDSSNG